MEFWAVRRIDSRTSQIPDLLSKLLSSVSLSQGSSHDNPVAPSSAHATNLSDVESATWILQSQSTIQVSTRRNQKTAGFCKQNRGRWPDIDPRSFQGASRCCRGSWIEGRDRGPPICYRCNQGTDIYRLIIILPLNENIENISKCGRSRATGGSDQRTCENPREINERWNTLPIDAGSTRSSIKADFPMTGWNSLFWLISLSKWIAIAADAKKLASRGVIKRTLNYINDAASITGYVQKISQSIESFTVSTHSYRSCTD